MESNKDAREHLKNNMTFANEKLEVQAEEDASSDDRNSKSDSDDDSNESDPEIPANVREQMAALANHESGPHFSGDN